MIDLKKLSKHLKQLAICGISDNTLQIRTGSYVLNLKNIHAKTGLLDVKLLKQGILTTTGKFELNTPVVEIVKSLPLQRIMGLDFKGVAESPYDFIMFNEGLAVGTSGSKAVWIETNIEDKFGFPMDAYNVLKEFGAKATFKLAKHLDDLYVVIESGSCQMFVKVYHNMPELKSKLPIRENFVYIKRNDVMEFFRSLLVYISEDKPNVTVSIADKILHVNDDCEEIETPKGFEHKNLRFNVLNTVKVMMAMAEPLCVSMPSDSSGPIVFRTKTMFDEYFGLVMPIVLKPQVDII